MRRSHGTKPHTRAITSQLRNRRMLMTLMTRKLRVVTKSETTADFSVKREEKALHESGVVERWFTDLERFSHHLQVEWLSWMANGMAKRYALHAIYTNGSHRIPVHEPAMNTERTHTEEHRKSTKGTHDDELMQPMCWLVERERWNWMISARMQAHDIVCALQSRAGLSVSALSLGS